MKTLFLLFVCTTVIINFGTCTDTGNITEEWEKFKKEYNKTYASADEETTRKNIFDNNVKMITDHNDNFKKGIVTFKMGMNKFGDLTHEEFKKRFSVREVIQKDANVDTENDVHVFGVNGSKQCDWTWLKAVNNTVHEQTCKSGWAYSTTDAIAARYQVYYNKTCLPLCINYLIKCSDGMGNHGCNGGLAQKACELVEEKKAMPDGKCFKNCSLSKMKNTVPLNITKCVTRKHMSADISEDLCTNGPVSASISAEKPSFQFAKEGIYYEGDCANTPNHEVLLVGFNGTDKNNSYWIIKNSFGKSWGENGFLKISTKANKSGCKIIGSVSYPVFPKK